MSDRLRAQSDHEQAKDDHEVVKAINGTVAKVDTTAERLYRLVKFMFFLACVALLFLVGLQIQILEMNRSVDRVQENATRNTEIIQELQEEVRDIQSVTRDVREVTPDEQASQDAVSRAVQLVPVILQVLCEVNPQAPSCQGG